MKKLILALIILQIFNSCISEGKKQSFTIDYLKSNKWCTTDPNYRHNYGGDLVLDSIQTCLEYNDNEVKSFKDGKLVRIVKFTFEQKSDKLIVAKSIDSTILSYYRIKSLDTISLFQGFEEGVYNDEFPVFDLIRVK
jgi:hypothetical protein